MAHDPEEETPREVRRFTKEPYVEEEGPRRIKSLKFCTFSGDEVRKAAVVQIWNNQFYGPDSQPVDHGLLDLRLGPSNKRYNCSTCHGSLSDCPGHFGYLKLTLPVFNIGYLAAIVNILKCICKSCARILLPEKERRDFLKKMRSPKLNMKQKRELARKVRDRCKQSRCQCCGYTNGAVRKLNQSFSIVQDYSRLKDGSEKEFKSAMLHIKETFHPAHILSAVRVHALFRKMIGEDCELLNLGDRPEKLILTDIAIPPSPIRPSSFVDSGLSNEDNISSILKKIINTNAFLREDLAAQAYAPKFLDSWEHLQVQVVEYINSDAVSKDSKFRGFVQRLKGKQGRLRSNLSGKRAEYTGRTVISPDPNLKITEVAIPILMARVLTYPERVYHHNIEKLRQCVRNGPSKYPGAVVVSHPDGRTVNLKFGERKNVANELKYGSIVHRHLEDGDIVLFNRQPSLHRMSIMCHQARIMPWRTLRFNESVCNPYNADFDGDEMNLHVPQTEEARTEALTLMGVQNNLCTPKNGQILVASTQDFLTSSYLITRKDTFYDRASFCLMCCYMGDAMELIDLPTPTLMKPVELWTGKQLFSVLVRPNARTRVFLNLIVKEKTCGSCNVQQEIMCPHDGFVYFRNSELISGQLGKGTLGNGNSNGLFAVLIRDYSSYAAASCMNRLAKLSARWIGDRGFSIGIDDVQPGESLNSKKKAEIDKGYETCAGFISKYNKGELQLQPGCNAAQTLEAQITDVLNKIRATVGDVCLKELHWSNSPLIMSLCGSKGSSINISQMIACVGQQSVGGRRAPNGFIDRTLPHFQQNSKTPVAKGFVANSFYSGLTATEFFFHTMGGREGLVDTAVKTAETGYMSRRLTKVLEDLFVDYDLTVRDASHVAVQLVYGDDGLDPSKMEGKGGKPLDFSQLLHKVKATCPSGSVTLSPMEIRQMRDEKLPHVDINSSFRDLLSSYVEDIANSLSRTKEKLGLDNGNHDDRDMDALERTAARLAGISSKQLQVFLDLCIRRYHSKRIEPGAPVGVIGAQSIGEPGTQMTLKTFHFAGVASMNVTLGVPRIKEIIDAIKNISTPIITTVLEQDDDEISAKIVKGSLQKILLEEVAKSIKVVHKPVGVYIAIVLDIELIESLYMGISAYSVKESILKHPKIKLREEQIKVSAAYKLKIYSHSEKNPFHADLHSKLKMLKKVIVKGISSIERVVISEEESKKDKRRSYKLFVEGTNLLAVMGTPGVKSTETTSNHVIEVKQTLGIEAARKCIINEINYTMGSYGMNIDIRHMMILADVMTCMGEVLSVTRTGMAKMKESILLNASFEKTDEHLFNAALDGSEDKLEGVSECVIMGTPMQYGTGIMKVVQRVDPLPELKYAPDPIIS